MSKRKEGVQITNSICSKINDLGIKQAELARAVNVKREYINRLINGKIRPSVGLALKIAAALDCSVEDIFTVVE